LRNNIEVSPRLQIFQEAWPVSHPIAMRTPDAKPKAGQEIAKLSYNITRNNITKKQPKQRDRNNVIPYNIPKQRISTSPQIASLRPKRTAWSGEIPVFRSEVPPHRPLTHKSQRTQTNIAVRNGLTDESLQLATSTTGAMMLLPIEICQPFSDIFQMLLKIPCKGDTSRSVSLFVKSQLPIKLVESTNCNCRIALCLSLYWYQFIKKLSSLDGPRK
jgi:hypothetical protein